MKFEVYAPIVTKVSMMSIVNGKIVSKLLNGCLTMASSFRTVMSVKLGRDGE